MSTLNPPTSTLSSHRAHRAHKGRRKAAPAVAPGRRRMAARSAQSVLNAAAPVVEPVAENTQPPAQRKGLGSLLPGRRRRGKGGRNDQGSAQTLVHAPKHLLALKPKERYVFRSDYFEIDDQVATILAFVHDEAAHDGFLSFWGIDRIPGGLDESVTTVVLDHVVRRDEKWVATYIKTSEQLDKLDEVEQASTGTASTRRRAHKVSEDLNTIIAEIQNGASYLTMHSRLLVRAADLETLEESLARIARLYIDRFGTLRVAPHMGRQRQELSTLLATHTKKRGKGFGFTSTELAGNYCLVTNGLNDRGGEYVGYMVGDVNNSAVLMDVDAYDHHVVVADATASTNLGRQKVSAMWASKISQAAMLNNHRAVHLILDETDLDTLGPRLDSITARVDLNAGEVNMFEMFGERSDELSIFAAQMNKLVLMFEQVYETTDADRAIIRGELEKTATQFYVDQRMWRLNAAAERERLRVVDLAHTDVPRLQTFVAYLESARKAQLTAAAQDPESLHAYNVLASVARNMLNNNGDLFNNHTAQAFDGIGEARRVIYDFSRLRRRGEGVAMAQLVNIIGFAVARLRAGDVVFIHGAENIDARVKDYVMMQLGHLFTRGGRVVYVYNDVDACLGDTEFSRFDAADYTLFGAMRSRTVDTYQQLLGQQIPPDLANLVAARDRGLTFLRRGATNVVFHADLTLGINPERQARQRAQQQAQRKAASEASMAELMGQKAKDVAPGGHLTSPGGTRGHQIVDSAATSAAAQMGAAR